MYKVTKIIYFSFGHRLMDYEGKCAKLHGHNGRVEITLSSRTLDEKGMVIDFGDLKRSVDSWIDENLDHKMILREDDPSIPHLEKLGEPIYKMKVDPTAENLAKLIFKQVQSLGFPVEEVKFWETESSFATFREKD